MSLKSELKNGAVVETRNGNMYVKVDDTLLNINMNGTYIILDNYSEDLKCISEILETRKDMDIVKINSNTFNCFGYCNNAISEVKENIWTWERSAEILDKVEKEYLSAVIKPFRNRVTHLKKCGDSYGEFINIYIERDGCIVFPYFKPGIMYKGMELNKKYTLEELGL